MPVSQKEEINNLRISISDLTNIVNTLVSRIDNLTETLGIKDKVIFDLENKINALEQYSKINNLIISGPERFLDSDNPRSDFIEFVDVKLNEKIENFDIVAIHKLSSKDKKISKIIVKLHFHETKYNILKNAKKLRKDTGIYINENLTNINADIFFRARVLRKDKLIHSCWTSNGITFIKLQENSTKKEF